MRVARLATVDRTSQPHVVPVVFATDGQKIYTPLDDKPKRLAPSDLKRVRNILANPSVALVADEYDEDWTRLAWVMVRGSAEVVESGATHAAGVRLLREKYPQYADMRLDGRPVIAITPVRVTSWGAVR
jgi:PPOX class probable F420-dependent enzyme